MFAPQQASENYLILTQDNQFLQRTFLWIITRLFQSCSSREKNKEITRIVLSLTDETKQMSNEDNPEKCWNFHTAQSFSLKRAFEISSTCT